MWETPPLRALEEAVRDPKSSIGMRMRAAYFLRQYYDNAIRNGGEGEGEDEGEGEGEGEGGSVARRAIGLLAEGLADARHGSLLRHEFAYVMGQLRDERCCPALEAALSDPDDDVMVRHECGEALGAIGAERSVPVLEGAIGLSPDTPEIGQTCQLALDHLLWRRGGGDGSGTDEPAACACMLSPYSSVDPAPPHPDHAALPEEVVGDMLGDPDRPLFERYRAMFSLRNRGGADAVRQLGLALTTDRSSALLRHEVAYVLGQMQHPAAVEALAESLRRPGEHAMVRHESAEALGAIEGRWDDCERILTEFLDDPDVVIRESCEVALDAADYWGQGGERAEAEAETEPEDGSGQDGKGGEGALSFVRQKAVTNGRGAEAPSCSLAKEGRMSHFNVAV